MTTLMRFDPMRDLWGMQRDLDRLIGSLGMTPSPTFHAPMTDTVTPTIDVLHRGDDLVVRAEMPGISPENIDISVADGVLTLKGERHEEHEKTEDEYVVRETTSGSFMRTMSLPEGLEPASIHAEYRDGILEIVLPGAGLGFQREAVHVPIKAHEATPIEGHH